jgi:hypothetical protein
MTKKIQASEILAGLALLVKILEYVGKQIPWGEGRTFEPTAALFSYLSIALLLASVLLWLHSSNKRLEKVDDIAGQLGEMKKELVRLESALAEKSKTNVELEELFQFRPDMVSADNMRNVWTTLLWRLRERYWATNYITDADIFQKGYGESALAIQATKIKVQHADIKKIFIVQDDAELQKMQTVFKNQHDLGIQVKYIFFEAIQSDPALKTKASKLATIDFGLIDSRITLLWFLNKDRCVDSGQVVLGSNGLAPYKDFFDSLFTEAKLYS